MPPAHNIHLQAKCAVAGDLGQAETAALLMWAPDLCLQAPTVGVFAVLLVNPLIHICAVGVPCREQSGVRARAAEPMPVVPHMAQPAANLGECDLN